jgi:hypothetical protein
MRSSGRTSVSLGNVIVSAPLKIRSMELAADLECTSGGGATGSTETWRAAIEEMAEERTVRDTQAAQ